MPSNPYLPKSFKQMAFVPNRKSIAFKLLEACLLRPKRKHVKKSLEAFHLNYRRQLMRFLYHRKKALGDIVKKTSEFNLPSDFKNHPDFKPKILSLILQANCPPPGCGYMPRPLFHCHQFKTCPFCFVRLRLVPIYERIMSLPESVLQDSKVVIWRRKLAVTDELPFFTRGAGPHVWLKAVLSAQVVVPFFTAYKLKETVTVRGQEVCFRYEPSLEHFGVHVVPAAVSVSDVMSPRLEKLGIKSMTISSFAGLDSKSMQAKLVHDMQVQFSMRWRVLFSTPCGKVYRAIHDMYPDQNLMRFQQRKV